MELDDSDYDSLRARLETRSPHASGAISRRTARRGYSFDSTIDLVLGALEGARERYFAQSHAARTRFEPARRADDLHFYSRGHRLRNAWGQHRRLMAPFTARALGRALGRDE